MLKSLLAAVSLLIFTMTAHAAKPAPAPAAAAEKKTEASARFEKAAGEMAGFAAGCFWGTEEFFRKIPGVTATRVGYEGGGKAANYKEVSSGDTGHAETLQIKFDPKKVSYETLLDQFFKMHDPTTMNRQGNDVGTQYRSEIFTYTPEQAKMAAAFKQKVEKSGAWKEPISTKIEPAMTFYEAEDYHQQYLVKNPGGYDNHHLRNLNFDAKK